MISQEMKNDIDLSYLLDIYVHFDIQKTSYENKTLGDLLDHYIQRDDLHENIRPHYDYLCEAVKHNEKLKNAVLVSQSTTEGYSMDEVIACAFRTDDDSVYVCYRGTGDGKWLDNAEGIVYSESLMQKSAASYCDQVLRKTDENSRIVLTGHSKGGNLSQYSTMMSEYRDRISSCYSMDGQGMSQKALDKMKAVNGEEKYNQQLEKIYSICGENDFVNVLGIRMVSFDHKILLETPNAKDFGALNWSYDENGNVVSAASGEISLFAEKLNNEMLRKLSPEQYEDSAVFVMSMLERIMTEVDPSGNARMGGIYLDGTGKTKKATFEETIGFLVHGVPLVADTLLQTKEGQQLIQHFLYEGIKDVYDKYGIPGVVGTVFLVGVGSYCVAKIYLASKFVVDGVIVVLYVLDKVFEMFPEFSEAFISFLHEMVGIVVDAIENIKAWYDRNFNTGYIQATQNPYIQVDTEKLQAYADKLEKIINRVKTLDWSMNSLYSAVSIWDLGRVIGANYLVGGVSTLKNCRKYLIDTKRDFDDAESYINEIMRF